MRRLTRLINHYVFVLGALPQVVGASSAVVGRDELAKSLRFYQTILEFEAPFKQIKHLKEMGVDLKSEGRLDVERPDRVSWEILKPSHVEVTIDKTEVRMTSGEGADKSEHRFQLSELPKDKGAGGVGLIMPWLLLDAERIAADYKITKVDDKTFRFQPRTSSKLFEQIEIVLAPTGFLRRLTLNESSGDFLEITFESPKIKKRAAK